MIDPFPGQVQPEHSPDAQTACTSAGIPRRVSVRGTGGVSATVFVTVQRGQVWVSIQPPFTWEAIMEHGKVDELIDVLGLARDEARRMERGKRVSRGDRQQPVCTGVAVQLIDDRGVSRPVLMP